MFMENLMTRILCNEERSSSQFSWTSFRWLCLCLNGARWFIFMDSTLKPMSYTGQMQGSLYSWKTSWLLSHAMEELCYESTNLCLYSFTPCANINFIVFGLIWSLIGTTIYRTWCGYSTTGIACYNLASYFFGIDIHIVVYMQSRKCIMYR